MIRMKQPVSHMACHAISFSASVVPCHSTKSYDQQILLSPLCQGLGSQNTFGPLWALLQRLKHVTALPRFRSVWFVRLGQWCWCGQLVWIIIALLSFTACSRVIDDVLVKFYILQLYTHYTFKYWIYSKLFYSNYINNLYLCVVSFCTNNGSHWVA